MIRGYSADYGHTKGNQEDITDLEAVPTCLDVIRAVSVPPPSPPG